MEKPEEADSRRRQYPAPLTEVMDLPDKVTIWVNCVYTKIVNIFELR